MKLFFSPVLLVPRIPRAAHFAQKSGKSCKRRTKESMPAKEGHKKLSDNVCMLSDKSAESREAPSLRHAFAYEQTKMAPFLFIMVVLTLELGGVCCLHL